MPGWWRMEMNGKVYKCLEGYGHGASNQGCMVDWKATIKASKRS